MRLLLTTDTIGGVWTFTRELTQQLLARRHAVALVSFGRDPDKAQLAWSHRMEMSQGADFLYRAGEAPLEWMQSNDAAFSDGANLLVDTAESFAADLLHSSQFCWGATPCDLPRVITAHSDVLSWGAACRPGGLQDAPWLSRYRGHVQDGLNGADAVVAPTAWMQRELANHFDVPCVQSVIHNGRTLSMLRAKNERKLQAISVGRLWDAAKGLASLLEIDAPMPILIAGEDSFEGTAASTGKLASRGYLDEADLLQLFGESSVYLATSLYEPFGLAPLEAALCGCAIVARNIPSLREVWADAALFYNDAAELTAILRELAQNPGTLALAQNRARKRGQAFTAERMVSRYVDLYQSLLSRSGGRALASDPQKWVTHAA